MPDGVPPLQLLLSLQAVEAPPPVQAGSLEWGGGRGGGGGGGLRFLEEMLPVEIEPLEPAASRCWAEAFWPDPASKSRAQEATTSLWLAW